VVAYFVFVMLRAFVIMLCNCRYSY